MAMQLKKIKKSEKYKYVELYHTAKGVERWRVGMFGNSKCYDTEREAAKAVDLKLISKGKEPVNILVRM